MKTTPLFIIGAPRSGTTMLARILGSHSMIKGGPEPHLLTPLAHLGVWAQVQKAPYDHIVSALGQQAFVNSLPNKLDDYWPACRAYCDVLYEQFLGNSGKSIVLDKTPEYATVLPFISRVFPDAHYVVLTRHPAALFSSYANSFFCGDFQLANKHDPVLQRYIPALAAFLRQRETTHIHLRYEDLVSDPEKSMNRVYDHIGIPYEQESINYGNKSTEEKMPDGLGDPLGISKHQRPSTASVQKWAQEIAMDAQKLEFVKSLIDKLDPRDLEITGYPTKTLWDPLEQTMVDHSTGNAISVKHHFSGYKIRRRLIVHGRSLAHSNKWLTTLLQQVRLACDVLLREY